MASYQKNVIIALLLLVCINVLLLKSIVQDSCYRPIRLRVNIVYVHVLPTHIQQPKMFSFCIFRHVLFHFTLISLTCFPSHQFFSVYVSLIVY